jgi:hypothetical protein
MILKEHSRKWRVDKGLFIAEWATNRLSLFFILFLGFLFLLTDVKRGKATIFSQGGTRPWQGGSIFLHKLS